LHPPVEKGAGWGKPNGGKGGGGPRTAKARELNGGEELRNN